MIVSVLIPTYNSARFIQETLNSVFIQTYPNIELIISDDCSTDQTIKLCQQWLQQNSSRFRRAILVKTPTNYGIAGNYNHALSHASGEWVKCLDSDDILLPNCLTTFVQVCSQSPQYDVWYSGWEQIDEKGTLTSRDKNSFPRTSARKQLRSYLLHIQDIHTNTIFIRTSTLRSIGGFDMDFPMSQDIPLIYKLLTTHHALGIIPDAYTMQFRFVTNSVSHSSHPLMNQSIADCRYHYSRYYLQYGLFLHYYNAFVNHYLRAQREGNLISNIFGYILRCFDFVHWYYKTNIILKSTFTWIK